MTVALFVSFTGFTGPVFRPAENIERSKSSFTGFTGPVPGLAENHEEFYRIYGHNTGYHS